MNVKKILLSAGVLAIAALTAQAVEDGLGTNVVRNLRVTAPGSLSLGGTAVTNWTLLPVGTGAVSLVDYVAWSNAVQSATNALNTNKLDLSGGVMTGPLTNEAGYYGDGTGLTNLNATNLTGMINAASLGAGTTNPAVFLRGDQAWTNQLVGNATTRAFTVNTNQLAVTNGNVGIGTNAPSARLEVKGSGGNVLRLVSSAGSEYFLVDDDKVKFVESAGRAEAAGSGDLGAHFNMGSCGNNAYALLALGPSVGFTNNYFEVNSIGDKGGDVFVVSSNRYVGINTTNPVALLDIKTPAGAFNRAMRLGSVGANGAGAYIEFSSSATTNIGARIGGYRMEGGGSNALAFFTGTTATERIRIIDAGFGGKVGIGTNIPAEKLHVIGNIKASGTNAARAVVMAQGATNNVSGADALIPFSASYIAVTGAAAELTASIDTNNAVAGQVLILRGGVGNPVTLTNGGNVALSSGVDFTFAENNTMRLIWNGAKWTELNRVAQ